MKRWIRGDDPHYPRTSLICLETTQNMCGGKVLPLAYVDAVGEICKSRNLRLHIDGARFFNASVAMGVTPARLAQAADSVNVCLSKGLGAPIGSILAGSADFIYRAKRARKLLGGGMRQVGLMAKCALIALEENVERLALDHANAKALAAGIATIEGVTLASPNIDTNIVYFSFKHNTVSYPQVIAELKTQGVIVSGADAWGRVRLVTHLDISSDDVEFTIKAFREAVQRLSAQ